MTIALLQIISMHSGTQGQPPGFGGDRVGPGPEIMSSPLGSVQPVVNRPLGLPDEFNVP
jgi:hypothetical protein